MTITGLDLSLTSSGVAWIDEDGSGGTTSVKSKGAREDDLSTRASRLRGLTDSILSLVAVGSLTVIESPSFGSAGSGTWDRSGLWWLVVDGLFERGNPVAMVSPLTLKKWVTGSGKAEKNTVGVNVGRLFPDTEILTDDAADALGLAHIGACYLGYPVLRKPQHNEKNWAAVKWPRGSVPA